MTKGYSQYFTNRGVMKRAFMVAVIVGTILNIINQGSNLLTHDVVWWKVILTYIVPYCVSSYSSAVERSKRHQPARHKSEAAVQAEENLANPTHSKPS